MNKTNIELQPGRELEIQTALYTRLGAFWNHLTLSGNYWRLYYHDAPGAGVTVEGRRYRFLPDAIYLLPPFPDAVSWLEQPVGQYYIHFAVNGLSGHPTWPIHRLDITSDFIERIRLLHAPPSRLATGLNALAITASALARLPEGALCQAENDLRIAAVCDWMNTHPHHEVDIAQLAKRAHLAPNSFIRRFRQATGVSPYHYLIQLRYHIAARLLETTDLAIDSICAEIGVKDRFHFSRTFKKHYGMPPAAYRNAGRSSLVAETPLPLSRNHERPGPI